MTQPAGAEKENKRMKQNTKNEREQKGGKQKGGKPKEQFEYVQLQNDEFDPYAIVVLNQL